MSRSLLIAGLAVLFLASPRTPIHAQTGAHVALAPIVPVGDLGDFANPGFMAAVGAHRNLGDNPLLSGHVTAFFGSVSHDDVEGDATHIPGIGLGGRYQLGTGPTRPYAGAAVGALQHRYVSDTFEEGSETKAFVSAGGGVETYLAGIGVFADARLTLAEGTSFFGLFIGGVKRF